MAPTLAEVQRDLENIVGHPGIMWEDLQQSVQEDAIMRFADVQEKWLDLMWALDVHRAKGVPPRRMGNMNIATRARLDAIYRNKGNWFATLASLILQNQTDQTIRPRTRVRASLRNIRSTWLGLRGNRMS
jgi:hypothetical protein